MNLIPSIRAYIAHRIGDLSKETSVMAAARRDELEALDQLCKGLNQQAAIFDDMVSRSINRDRLPKLESEAGK